MKKCIWYMYLCTARWAVSLHYGWYCYLLNTEYLLSYFYKLLHSEGSLTIEPTILAPHTNAFAWKLSDKRCIRYSTRYSLKLSTSVFPLLQLHPANQIIAIYSFGNCIFFYQKITMYIMQLLSTEDQTIQRRMELHYAVTAPKKLGFHILVGGSVSPDCLHKR